MKAVVEGALCTLAGLLATAVFYNTVIIPGLTRDLETRYNAAAGDAMKSRAQVIALQAEKLYLQAELDAARRSAVRPDRIPAPAEPLPAE